MPLIMKKTVNGQPVKIRLTAEAGAGAPVGTIIPMYKKSSPSGYLYCDGSTFDETAYPLLYAYLGTNVLPDYREFALVGAEQNTTDTIATHDVYTQGEGKDDQLQDFEFNMSPEGGAANSLVYGSNTQGWSSLQTIARAGVRIGDVTRGKRKAVYFYIKATSGLSENAQDNVINTLNEQRSYSTEEVNTGKKWIDGKPIYQVTFQASVQAGVQTQIGTIADISEMVHTYGNIKQTGGSNVPIPYYMSGTDYAVAFCVISNGIAYATSSSSGVATVTFEYTKTTD